MFFPHPMALHLQEPHQHQHQHQHQPTTPLQAHLAPMSPRQPRRRVPLLRRRKVQAVRLGGKKPRRRIILGLVKIFRKMRLRWLKLQYVRMLRRLKEYYRNLLKELAEAGATIETMLFMESTFVIPGGITLSSCPSRYGSDRPRTITM